MPTSTELNTFHGKNGMLYRQMLGLFFKKGHGKLKQKSAYVCEFSDAIYVICYSIQNPALHTL